MQRFYTLCTKKKKNIYFTEIENKILRTLFEAWK